MRSDGTVSRASPGGGGTLGTATTAQPAACAEVIPVGESSSATLRPGGTPSRVAARRQVRRR